MNRQEIDKQYGVSLSDSQWRIIQAELTDKDDDEIDTEIVEDVITNLDHYEAEYAWWEDLLAKAQHKND
jgi:hypothetical protein